MKLGVISLGCDKATVDSERLVGELVGHGAVITQDLPHADVILINTCGFIDAAKQESINAILQAAQLIPGWGESSRAAGCLVQRYKQSCSGDFPRWTCSSDFSDLHHRVPRAEPPRAHRGPHRSANPASAQFLGDAPHVRYLKISEGCDHTVLLLCHSPHSGRHRTEPLERLVREAQQLEAEGAQEINLVAQDLGHYGRDVGPTGPKLPDLLEALLRETSVPWYRLLYVYSAGLSERLVELVGREPRIVPYIDMPIQHANDRMLERMRRPERRDTLRHKLAWLRDAIPGLALRTTCLVGFPGETDDEFRELLAFLEEAQFDRLGAFSYSPQDGTRAMVYPDDVPDELKRDRLEELLELQRAISAERLTRFVGREAQVLVDRIADPDEEHATHVGRVPWQADDVDGVTYVAAGGWAEPGRFVRVRVTASEDYDFRAVALT